MHSRDPDLLTLTVDPRRRHSPAVRAAALGDRIARQHGHPAPPGKPTQMLMREIICQQRQKRPVVVRDFLQRHHLSAAGLNVRRQGGQLVIPKPQVLAIDHQIAARAPRER